MTRPIVVFHQQGAEVVVAAQAADELAEVAYLRVGEPAGGLVQQEQSRSRGERAGQLDPFERAVRQALGRPVRHVAQVELGEDVHGLPFDAALPGPGARPPGERSGEPGPLAGVGPGHGVLQHGERGEQREVLEGTGDAEPHHVVWA
ncbi:hypothetical protein GCM10018952_41250 [Streptosporangium vulgare]